MKMRFSVALPAFTLLAFAIHSTSASTLPAAVPRAIVSADSAWGTAADSWAGYTGALKIWVPIAVSGGWTLRFRSAELGRQAPATSFWNATTSYDSATHIFTVSAPAWGGEVAANSILDIGFNGSGVLNTAFVLEDCVFNGQPCVASVLSAADSRTTLAGLKAGSTPPADTATGGGTDTTGTGSGSADNFTGALEVLLSVDSAWEGGYGGTVSIKNLSSTSMPAGGGWKAILKFPDLAAAQDVFRSGPWNLHAAFGADGTVTLSPMPWTSAVPAGGSVSSGFNGGAVAHLRTAAGGDPSVTVVFSASAGGGGATGGGSGSGSGDVTPIVDTVGLPTGSPPGNFLYSPYKDVGISMNWNTYVISTAATGIPTPLLSALPSRTPAVTWAFATGECGQESWAGIAPAALAAANVQSFADSNRNYVISTGGAAGSFRCSSPAGMRTFINRYASKNLVGMDFDIESGQSAAEIDSLVQQLAAVEADYPNLRFSFTLATLGSSNGAAASAPYGDLNVTGYNVIQALKRHPLANYTINLMVMDYGPASSAVCMVANGRCDMGRTAIQAAQNLNQRFGVPYSRIELTPMIGVNDVTDELFSLADTDTMLAFVKSNQLAGVHFWSVDRDTPCSQASASPTCSSVPAVPVWGWTNRFAAGLGL